MAASKGGKAKKGARRARKAAPKPGARTGKGGAGTMGAAVAGGAAKLDAARVRAWELDGRQGVYWGEARKRWQVYIHYGEQLHLGYFKTKEDAIACRLLAEDRIAAGCHPKTGKYVPEAERPKPPKTQLKNNAHLLGKPAQKFSDAALGEHATDFAAKVDAGTLDIDQVVGVPLENKSGKWHAQMKYKKKTCKLGSRTADLAEAIRRRLLAEKAIALFPDKNPQDYVTARMAAAGAGKKRKRADADRAEGAAGGAAAATASPLPRAPPPPPPAVPSPSLAEQLAAAQEMLAVERAAAAELRAVMAARERQAEARRVEAERLRARHAADEDRLRARHAADEDRLRARHAADEDRLRTRLAAVEREAAALRTVGGDDGQCARSRPYYWQR